MVTILYYKTLALPFLEIVDPKLFSEVKAETENKRIEKEKIAPSNVIICDEISNLSNRVGDNKEYNLYSLQRIF